MMKVESLKSKVESMMNGQVALIVLIVSAVVLTLGLSISRKTTVETKIDTDEELLKKAFNAAESGIDYYLGSKSTTYENTENQESASVTVKDIGGTMLSLGEYTPVNQRMSFWLVGHNSDGSIGTNYYSQPSVSLCVANGFTGKIKVDYFYIDVIGYKVNRRGYNIGGSDDTGFIGQNLASDCFNFDLGGGNSPLLISIIPLSNGTQISMKGTADFPSQGEEISSIGRAGDVNTGTGVNKKVTVIRSYEIPFFMMDAITSGSSVLSK